MDALTNRTRLDAARVDILYRNAPQGAAATLLNAALITFVHRHAVPLERRAAWMGATLVVFALRAVDYAAYVRAPRRYSARVSELRFSGGLLLSALVWGASAYVIFSPKDYGLQCLLGLVLGGMVAGAAGTFAASPTAVFSFSVTILLPLLVQLFSKGDEFHVVVACFALIFLLMMSISAWRGYRTTLLALSLGFENDQLVGVLSKAKHDAERLNVELEAEVVERRRAEEQLRRNEEGLVRVVEERTLALRTASQQLRDEIAARENMREELARREKLDSIGVLAGGIAHDFNNLLAVILGSVELATLRTDPADDVRERLDDARCAITQARRLTSQLLTFSTGGAPVRAPVDVASLIRECVGLFSESSVSVNLCLNEPLGSIHADHGQIAQVLHNLVLNAVQAMPNGGTVTIAARAEHVGADSPFPIVPGAYVVFSVSDEGDGVAEGIRERIFDPYFTTKPRGAGLGLATSHSIVTKHGGHIGVESRSGKGATFFVYLPVLPPSSLPNRTEEYKLAGLPRGTTVLVLDDEPAIRQSTALLLTHLGATVTNAASGEQAIEEYRRAFEGRAPFAVVIADLTIPGGLGGKQVVERLCAIDPNANVIASSGYSSDPVLASYRDFGFCGVLAKPYTMRDVERAILAVLRDGGR